MFVDLGVRVMRELELTDEGDVIQKTEDGTVLVRGRVVQDGDKWRWDDLTGRSGTASTKRRALAFLGFKVKEEAK